ncbi:hypothetical protein B0H10DRAFT_1953970 [Mycena sp. CBHHK59/15]|nr:hypothetical protein B0H10DRAFT_1953970 [Mycena sp. CBHHK59/15]
MSLVPGDETGLPTRIQQKLPKSMFPWVAKPKGSAIINWTQWTSKDSGWQVTTVPAGPQSTSEAPMRSSRSRKTVAVPLPPATVTKATRPPQKKRRTYTYVDDEGNGL